jgi:hypothetical protein
MFIISGNSALKKLSPSMAYLKIYSAISHFLDVNVGALFFVDLQEALSITIRNSLGNPEMLSQKI